MKVTNGKIVISDPCYSRVDNPQYGPYIIENCKNGDWKFHVSTEPGSGRDASLKVFIDEFDKGEAAEVLLCGVDSGQCGVFNEEFYPHGEVGDYGDLNTFYGKACEASGGHHPDWIGNYEVENYGVCCRSGYGDGGYDATIFRNKDGQCVGVEIVFIGDEADEDIN